MYESVDESDCDGRADERERQEEGQISARGKAEKGLSEQQAEASQQASSRTDRSEKHGLRSMPSCQTGQSKERSMVLWMQMVERDVSQCRGRSKRTAVSVENIRVQIGS